MKDYAGIDIFVPGTWMEREIDWDRLFHIFVLTGAAMGLMVLFAVVIMIPMMAAGLIYVDLVTLNVYIDPVALLAINFASFGLILPPIWYVKRNGYSLKSIGLSSLKSAKEAIIGLGVGSSSTICGIFPSGSGASDRMSSCQSSSGWRRLKPGDIISQPSSSHTPGSEARLRPRLRGSPTSRRPRSQPTAPRPRGRDALADDDGGRPPPEPSCAVASR